MNIKDKVLKIINGYIEDQTKIKLIDTYFLREVRLELELIICPTYLRVEDYPQKFEMIIHSNKNLIKVSDGSVYKQEYSYIDILHDILLIDNIDIFYFPKEIEDEVLQDLQIHKRNKTIESLLI